MLQGKQSWGDADATPGDAHRVWPFDEVRTPELTHRDRPTVRAVLEVDHAVAKELNVVVGGLPARFRGEKNGGALSRQVARQSHRLPSKLMRVRRQLAR